MSPSTGNKDLIDIIRHHLLDEFTKHLQDKKRSDRRGLPEYCDPWWWPLHPAKELEHWGLLPDDENVDAKFKSLRPKEPGKRKEYARFLGSLGAKPGCVFIIGERPSFTKGYGQYMGKLDVRLNLLRAQPELREFLQQPPEFHVTDCIKFRGDPSRDKLTNEMRDISRRCLSAEFDLLKPKLVLLTDMAVPLFQRPNYEGVVFVEVPHWSKPAENEWPSRVVKSVQDAVTTT
jgi:hypothetical protein